ARARAGGTSARVRPRLAFPRMPSASPISSSTVSPFIRSAARNAATWTGVAAPDMIASMAAAASSRVRSRRSTRARIASTITGLDMAPVLLAPGSRPEVRLAHVGRAEELVAAARERDLAVLDHVAAATEPEGPTHVLLHQQNCSPLAVHGADDFKDQADRNGC